MKQRRCARARAGRAGGRNGWEASRYGAASSAAAAGESATSHCRFPPGPSGTALRCRNAVAARRDSFDLSNCQVSVGLPRPLLPSYSPPLDRVLVPRVYGLRVGGGGGDDGGGGMPYIVGGGGVGLRASGL